MGGSPSTGSSLLIRLLNRHPDIFAGKETYLFLHQQLVTDWEKYKHRLLDTNKVFGLKSPGWFVFNGAVLDHKEHSWKKSELKELVKTTSSFQDFVQQYFRKVLIINQKRIWIEKSPANAFNFSFFAAQNPNNQIIHVIRNPYDVVASLLGRNMDVWSAVGRCIFANAMALNAKDYPNYFQISYENLVNDPQKTVAPLLAFLKVPFTETIFNPTQKELTEVVNMPGWQHTETGNINNSSVNRWSKLPETQQRLIKAAFSAFEISPKYIDKYGLELTNSQAVFEALGYPFFKENPTPFLPKFEASRRKEIWNRTWRLYPSGGNNFMGIVSPIK